MLILSGLAVTMLAPASQSAEVAAPAAPDCFCTDSTGDRVELGQSICLNVGGRSFTAQCQMSLNVPMWRETAPTCLMSRMAPQIAPAGPPMITPSGVPSSLPSVLPSFLPQPHDPGIQPLAVHPKV